MEYKLFLPFIYIQSLVLQSNRPLPLNAAEDIPFIFSKLSNIHFNKDFFFSTSPLIPEKKWSLENQNQNIFFFRATMEKTTESMI